MPGYLKVLLGLNAILLTGILMAGLIYAQRPPETDATGAAYLRVNINPTDIPPMVNINPNQSVPSVQVTQMPDIRIMPTGCQNRANFQTAAAQTVSGPLMITYLNLPETVTATLSGPSGNQTVNLGRDGHLATAIFLQANQRLAFDAPVLYSGCRPD